MEIVYKFHKFHKFDNCFNKCFEVIELDTGQWSYKLPLTLLINIMAKNTLTIAYPHNIVEIFPQNYWLKLENV